MGALKGTRASKADVGVYKTNKSQNRGAKGQGGGDKSTASKKNYPRSGHMSEVDSSMGRHRSSHK